MTFLQNRISLVVLSSLMLILGSLDSLCQNNKDTEIKEINSNPGTYAPYYDFISKDMFWSVQFPDTSDQQKQTRISLNDLNKIKTEQDFEIEGLPDGMRSLSSSKISGDGEAMVFSGCTLEADTTWYIFYAEKKDKRWQIKEIVYESDIWTSHPCISADKKTIFFASEFDVNRSRNYGKSDIFRIQQQSDGTLSSPQNLGSEVNSEYEELSPYFSETDKETALYFASERPDGTGLLDIYKSDYDQETDTFATMQEVTRLNSPTDDAFYSSSTKDKKKIAEFFASKRGEGRKWRLYGVWDKSDLISPTFLVVSTVMNVRTKMRYPETNVIIREILNDKTKESFIQTILNDTTGKYNVVEIEKDREFEITSNSDDLVYDSFKIMIEDDEEKIVIRPDSNAHFSLELEKGREFEFTAQNEALLFDQFSVNVPLDDSTKIVEFFINASEKLTLRINFPTNKYNAPYEFTLDSNGVQTKFTWQRVLDILAENIIFSKDNIGQLLLVGHTDDVGNPSNNDKLGMNRVNFIIDELVKRGVPRELLVAETAGENQPLVKRDDEDMETYRKRLRRVELQKVSDKE